MVLKLNHITHPHRRIQRALANGRKGSIHHKVQMTQNSQVTCTPMGKIPWCFRTRVFFIHNTALYDQFATTFACTLTLYCVMSQTGGVPLLVAPLPSPTSEGEVQDVHTQALHHHRLHQVVSAFAGGTIGTEAAPNHRWRAGFQGARR